MVALQVLDDEELLQAQKEYRRMTHPNNILPQFRVAYISVSCSLLCCSVLGNYVSDYRAKKQSLAAVINFTLIICIARSEIFPILKTWQTKQDSQMYVKVSNYLVCAV